MHSSFLIFGCMSCSMLGDTALACYQCHSLQLPGVWDILFSAALPFIAWVLGKAERIFFLISKHSPSPSLDYELVSYHNGGKGGLNDIKQGFYSQGPRPRGRLLTLFIQNQNQYSFSRRDSIQFIYIH
jgi:hypothetical protein